MIHKIIKFCVAGIFIGGSILIYFHFLDGTVLNPILSTGTAPRRYQTTQTQYTVGDTVLVKGSAFCKLRNVPATVYWELQDDVSISYPPKDTYFPKGCYGDKSIEVETLPGFIGNTQYHFTGKIVYHLVARDIAVDLSTNDFYVSPKK